MANHSSRGWGRAIAVTATILAAAPLTADTADELRSELLGAYGLTRGRWSSECLGEPTGLKVVSGRGAPEPEGRTFAPGELVRVAEVRAGMLTGLDVLLEIVEPALLSWQDGPFTVYDQRRCRVRLDFDVPREVRKDAARARAAILAVVEVFADEGAAKDSGWNGRTVEPYPAEWEETRPAYERWRVARTNELVRRKTEEVLAFAEQTLSYMSSDEEYLAAFGAGAKARTYDSWSDCEAMLAASFYVSGSGKNSKGWADGQKVAWATNLAKELQDCYLAPE
jgi:hypothetical protein